MSREELVGFQACKSTLSLVWSPGNEETIARPVFYLHCIWSYFWIPWYFDYFGSLVAYSAVLRDGDWTWGRARRLELSHSGIMGIKTNGQSPVLACTIRSIHPRPTLPPLGRPVTNGTFPWTIFILYVCVLLPFEWTTQHDSCASRLDDE